MDNSGSKREGGREEDHRVSRSLTKKTATRPFRARTAHEERVVSVARRVLLRLEKRVKVPEGTAQERKEGRNVMTMSDGQGRQQLRARTSEARTSPQSAA